jgi:predicted site-specific integrase-resolvase
MIRRRKMQVKKQVKSREVVRRLYRRSTAAQILDTSVKMLRRLEEAGKLTVVRLGNRDVHYPAHEVEALAQGEGE